MLSADHLPQTNTSISSLAGLLEEELGGVSVEVMENAYLSFEAMVVHYYGYSCVCCGYHPSIIVMTSNKAATFNYTGWLAVIFRSS